MPPKKTNPFSIDQTDSTEEPTESLEETLEVNVDEDAEEPEAEQGLTKGPTRDDKKRERLSKFKAESDAKVADAERARQDAEQRAQRAEAEALAAREAARYAVKPPEQKDELGDEYQRLYRERAQISELFEAKKANKTLTEAEFAQMQKRDMELDIEQKKLVARMEIKKQETNRVDPEREMAVAQIAQLRTHFPDVFRNQAAYRWARARYELRVTEDPASDTWETVQSTMDEARAKFGLGGRKPPTEASKRKLMGAPAGNQAPRQEEEPVRRVVVGPREQKLADRLYPHIEDPKKRAEMWAKSAGKRAAAAQRQAG